ncbi:MAG TPA: hypothetical protein VJG31_01545 [Candidatus Nanoarchaeia archaeon]|nr:hypothetical protein [Candidatus Nanoarchaeia archaeon]
MAEESKKPVEAAEPQEKAKPVAALKVKKKKNWYPIISPKSMGQKELGEMPLFEAAGGLNRKVEINLKEVTGNMSDQNYYLSLKIVSTADNHLHTEILGYYLTSAYFKHVGRRKSGRITLSFLGVSADKKLVRIKPFLSTVFPVNRTVSAALRKKVENILKTELAKVPFENFVLSLMSSKIQSETRKILSKVFPLRELQIKSILLLGDADEKKMKKVSAVEEEAKEEAKAVEDEEAKETVEEESEAEGDSEDEVEEETEER